MVTVMLCTVTCSLAVSQREKARLKQPVFDLRRASRAWSCNLNATEADAAAVSPEMGEVLGSPQGRHQLFLTHVLLLSQRENARLKQHVLDLRRAARACGCDLNATEADAAAAYPELGEVLGLLTGDVAGQAGSQAPAPDQEQLHRPERHR